MNSEHSRKLLNHLAKAQDRIKNRDHSYQKLEKEIKEIRKIPSAPAQKRKLTQALRKLQSAMVDVIEAEKTMKFSRKSKTAEEIAMERKILALESRFNDYLAFRKERLKRFEQLEKMVEKKTQKPAANQDNAIRNSPGQKKPEKAPAPKKKSNEKPGLEDIKRKISSLKKKIKNTKMPKKKKTEIENKINEYTKRLKNL